MAFKARHGTQRLATKSKQDDQLPGLEEPMIPYEKLRKELSLDRIGILLVTITTKPGVAKVGSTVTLRKEPLNQFDNEAIQVLIDGQPDGYVSAYYKTRLPGTISAGRLYDQIGDTAEATVVSDRIVSVRIV